MNFTPKIPSIEEFLTQILELCTKYPDRVNPTRGFDCVYNLGGCYCLIGQWLKDYQNYDFVADPLRTVSNRSAASILESTYGAEIAVYARSVQRYADAREKDPVKWSEVGEMISERWGLGSASNN